MPFGSSLQSKYVNMIVKQCKILKKGLTSGPEARAIATPRAIKATNALIAVHWLFKRRSKIYITGCVNAF